MNCISDQHGCSCNGVKPDLPKTPHSALKDGKLPIQSQGAIPKTRASKAGYLERGHIRNRGHQRSKSGKSKTRFNFYPDYYEFDFDCGQTVKSRTNNKKQKNERENGIIDEEDVEISQV